MRRLALPEQQTGRNETADRGSQLGFRLAHHRSQQSMGKLPPDHCTDLSQLLGGAETVQPRHQRRMQARRDRPGRQRNRRSNVPGRSVAVRLQHCLRHLLDEQGNAVSALDDILPDARRQYLVSDEVIDHGTDFDLRQPIDGESSHISSSNPGRIEFRPERHDQQRAKPRDPVHRPSQCFEARGIAPMRILEDHQYRI